MRRMVLGCLLATAGLAFGANLVLVGDSTLAPRDETSPIGSWGEALAPYLKDDVKIIDTKGAVPIVCSPISGAVSTKPWTSFGRATTDASRNTTPRVRIRRSGRSA